MLKERYDVFSDKKLSNSNQQNLFAQFITLSLFSHDEVFTLHLVNSCIQVWLILSSRLHKKSAKTFAEVYDLN